MVRNGWLDTTSGWKLIVCFPKVGHGPVGNSLIENLLEQRERNVSITVLCHGEGSKLGGLNENQRLVEKRSRQWILRQLGKSQEVVNSKGIPRKMALTQVKDL